MSTFLLLVSFSYDIFFSRWKLRDFGKKRKSGICDLAITDSDEDDSEKLGKQCCFGYSRKKTPSSPNNRRKHGTGFREHTQQLTRHNVESMFLSIIFLKDITNFMISLFPSQRPTSHKTDYMVISLYQRKSPISCYTPNLKIKFPSCRDKEADVSIVSPSASLSDSITKMTFRALALRRHFPIRLRRRDFER